MYHILAQLTQFWIRYIQWIKFITQRHPQVRTARFFKIYQQFASVTIVRNLVQCEWWQCRYIINILHCIVHKHGHLDPISTCFFVHFDKILECVVVHVFKACRGACNEWLQVGNVMRAFIHVVVHEWGWEFLEHGLLNLFILKLRLVVHFVMNWNHVDIVQSIDVDVFVAVKLWV